MFRSLFRTALAVAGVAGLASLYRSPRGQRWSQSLREALAPRPARAEPRTDCNGVELDALRRMTSEGGIAP